MGNASLLKIIRWPGFTPWLLLPVFTLAWLTPAAARSAKIPVVAKWGRFEASLTSSTRYTNAIQQTTLMVEFISPGGQTNLVPGFWDGGRTWRVRFSPDTVGRWTYLTACSDAANDGLHARTGEFLCTAPENKNRFSQHGPVRVAEKGLNLQHADYTPFFWLGESAPPVARQSSLKELQFHSRVRSSQKFNAVLWTLWPGTDDRGQTAFSGHENITINLEFFRRLDAKVELLNRAGLLNAIAPLWEIAINSHETLPEDQSILLMRYAVARWGANDVAWVLAFEGGNVGKPVDRWQRIGRRVFSGINHAPVIILPGETSWVLNEFRRESWADAFSFQTAHLWDENSLQWFFSGPITAERYAHPTRPIIALRPPTESAPQTSAGRSVDTDKVRRLMWWSALLNTPAGVSYSSQPVASWDKSSDPRDPQFPADWPAWCKGLFLPGALDAEVLGAVLDGVDFRKLQPMPQCLAIQPGKEFPQRFIAAVGSEAKDLVLVYVPEDRSLTLSLATLPPSPIVTWINPRNGERKQALAVIGQNTCQFLTPGTGDWVLLIKAGK